MATAKNKGQEEKITALYGRLSDDDGVDMESNSISNQRTILQDYARKNGYLHPQFFYDDGVSGTTFDRPGFKQMQELVEAGKVARSFVKQRVAGVVDLADFAFLERCVFFHALILLW